MSQRSICFPKRNWTKRCDSSAYRKGNLYLQLWSKTAFPFQQTADNHSPTTHTHLHLPRTQSQAVEAMQLEKSSHLKGLYGLLVWLPSISESLFWIWEVLIFLFFFFFSQDGTEADWGYMRRVFWHRLAEEKGWYKTKSNQTAENNIGRWSCSPLPSHQASTKELHWFAACQGQKTGNLFNPMPFTSCFLTSP